MNDLAEFLLARIAEDEEYAHGDEVDHWCDGVQGMHMSGPRMRAECEAKRRIVEWHQSWPVLVESPLDFERGEAEGYDFARGAMSSLTVRVSRRMAWLTEREYVAKFGAEPPTGPILRLLALPYADHPDYRPEWRP